MSEHDPEPSNGNEPTPDPAEEPLKVDPPNFDWIEKGGDQEGLETREQSADEQK